MVSATRNAGRSDRPQSVRWREAGRLRGRRLKVSARAIFDATSRFHHPAHAEEWKEPGAPARIDALLALLLKGWKPAQVLTILL